MWLKYNVVHLKIRSVLQKTLWLETEVRRIKSCTEGNYLKQDITTLCVCVYVCEHACMFTLANYNKYIYIYYLYNAISTIYLNLLHFSLTSACTQTEWQITRHYHNTCLLVVAHKRLQESLEYVVHGCSSNIITSVYKWRPPAAFIHKMIYKLVLEVTSINGGAFADNTAVISTLNLGGVTQWLII